MSFSLSPAVTIREIDASAVVGSEVSSFAGFAGKFNWGPVNTPRLVTNESSLVSMFGFPDNTNAIDFFTIASFLTYSSGAWVTRIGNSEMTNAAYPDTTVSIANADELESKATDLATTSILAKYPGQVGNSLGISICSSAAQYEFTFIGDEADEHDLVFEFEADGKAVRSKQINYTSVSDANVSDFVEVGDVLTIDNTRYVVTETSDTYVTLDKIYTGPASPTTFTRLWKYFDIVSGAPAEGEFHLAIFDSNGYFRQKGSTLEVFESLSTKPDAVDDRNITTYWKTSLNRVSEYVYAGNAEPIVTDAKKAVIANLTGGNNSNDTVGLDEYIKGYDLLKNSEIYDIPLIIAGAITSLSVEGATLQNHIIDSIAEDRKDTLAFVSPPLDAVLNNKGKEAQDIVVSRKFLGSTSYATMDGNWKYMYDKYNDTFRWVPCCGDHAGLYAQTDKDFDPWVSAAGTSKGKLKGVTKFAFNPDKPARDIMYQNDVNPMFVMAIAGPVLFGDKTLLGKNTALSRNNVRRLLIVIEKAIAKSAIDMLFEFNDDFTRRRFVAMVDPFLKDAKGRRGLIDYKVIADETVNTAQVISNNSFVGSIYIKPNYTIGTIQLNFTVVNAAASFEEIIGQS